MIRLTTIEKSVIALAVIFVIAGTFMILRPMEVVEFSDHYHGKRISSTTAGRLSKKECQVSGGIAVTVGLSIGFLAFYRARD